jgi:hypothetical protein
VEWNCVEGTEFQLRQKVKFIEGSCNCRFQFLRTLDTEPYITDGTHHVCKWDCDKENCGKLLNKDRDNDMVFMLYTNTDKNIFVCDVTVCNEHSI